MTSLKANAIRLRLIIIVFTVAWGIHALGDDPTPQLVFLANEQLKVGVDLKRGGSIGFLADVKRGDNVVNVHDLGRWIGQSYYSGPKPFGNPHPDWKAWPWNPVSAGDVYSTPSQLLESTNDGRALYVKSIPMQWALQAVPSECTFETWITLSDRAVHVRNRLTNSRSDQQQYPALDQELPAVYTIGKLYRVISYVGDQPFTNAPLTEVRQPPAREGQPQWATWHATEHWSALVDDHDWGLGVIHPGVIRFIGGVYGKPNIGGPTDDSTGYVAPVRQEILDHQIVYEYRYTLVLDSLDNIRQAAVRQRPPSALPDYRFHADRQHWWFINTCDQGYPIRERLRLQLDQDDPQLYSPEGCWPAAEVPTLYVRAAFRTTNRTAELFWETTDQAGFPAEQSLKFDIIPDGQLRTYAIPLSKSPAYRGTIRRLRFDPVETAKPGETLELEWISHRPE